MGFLRDIMDKLLGASPDSRRPLTVQRSGQPKSIVSKEQVRAVADIVHPLEGHELDDQQLSCIACDAHSQLVLAGAGTGKTTTIVGLIKYLLKSETCSPTDILALSYTHASAEELGERVRSETGQTLEVMTFHKLGLEIIKRVTGKKPTISQVSAMEFSRDELKRRLQDPVYSRRLAMYLHNARYRKRTSRFEVSSQEEYERLLRENAPITIRGESVKSFGEVAIANFLYYNGIDYEYERPYEYDTSTDEYGQYHPDFYLKPYGVYIEFLAIDKNGQVPAYFKGKDGKSGTQTYLDSLSWKRRLHREKGTDCIELYAYQEFDDTLIEELKEQLKVRQIDLRPVDPELLWKELGRKRDDAIDSVASLFGTLISLLKSTGMTSGELKRRCANRRALFLLSLLDPVYQAYQEMLAHNDQIDFDDMINLARKYVDDGLYRHQYRFVIIDEYQDISASRQGLVQALRAQSDFRLFCVGDDWQSIYRFSGSDIGFILNFEDQWGPSVINKIETTRRFPQKLIDVSGIFVMTNPHQTKKQLRSTVESALLPLEVVCGYTERKSEGGGYPP